MDGYDSSHFRYAFESCKTFKDGSVSPTDFASICRRYKLNYKQVMDQIGTDGEGRYSLDAFIHYMKRYQHSQAQHSHHQTNYYDQESFTRPTSPIHRPSSAGKHTRQAVYSSASSGHHHTRMSTRYPMSPVAPATAVYNDQETFTPEDHHFSKRRQEMTRTPDFYLSPEEKMAMSRTGHERERLRPAEPDHYIHEHRSTTSRSRVGVVSRATNERGIDSPPPIGIRRGMYSGRSDKARSFRDEDSDVDDTAESFYPPPAPHTTRSSCKKCKSYARHLSELQDDLKASRNERERLEQSLDAVRKDLRVAQNSDVAYAQIYHENERLKHEVKRLKKDSSMDPDSERAYFDRQYEEMKKIKDDLEDELQRERSAHRHYKRECTALKDEYNNLRLKNEELQRTNWKLTDENQRLSVKLMDDDRSSLVSRRPGDGGSEEHSARSSLAGELPFQRQSAVRQTYHGPEGRQPVRDGSRSRKSRLEMKRTSSEGKALDEHPTKDETNYTHKAKSHVSATSDAGSMVEGFGLSMVSTTPDEQSQVFMVLGEDVSKSVLPEGLPKERELAMIYALQNCHSIQELIKCLVSYGVSTTSDKLQGFQIENEHLKKVVDHLKSKHATLAHSFESSKANMDSMYHTALKVEANNTRMKLIIKLCQQACEVYEVLLDLRASESRNGSTSTTYFPSFDYSDSIDAASTRNPDREAMMIKHSPAYRARSLLHSLEGNHELQRYLPPVHKSRQNSSDYHASHWHPGTLSQNTGTTSGLSSMSGGMEVEISQAEIDRLRQYTQALRQYENHLVATLTAMEGVKGLEIVKKNEIIRDSNRSEQSRGVDITELEDAAHAEELCKVREEKAELRSQIYMMEQEKRRMELEVSRMLLHHKKIERQVYELQYKLSEERRKRKKERKGRKGESSISHEANMSELSIEYAAALEREKELGRRYDELFTFMQSHVKESQCTTDDLMRFVKELRQANSALVDAFEKSKKRQQAEKRRMKQDLVSYMNRVQNSSIPAIDAVIPNAPVT